MRDEGKSKEQLVAELSVMSRQIAEFEGPGVVRGVCGSANEVHERLTSILDSMNAVAYVADMTSYEILFANRNAYSVFGDLQDKICWQMLQQGKTGPCVFCTNDKLLDVDGNPSGVYVWEFQNTVTGRWYSAPGKGTRIVLSAPLAFCMKRSGII